MINRKQTSKFYIIRILTLKIFTKFYFQYISLYSYDINPRHDNQQVQSSNQEVQVSNQDRNSNKISSKFNLRTFLEFFEREQENLTKIRKTSVALFLHCYSGLVFNGTNVILRALNYEDDLICLNIFDSDLNRIKNFE